jgi:hypothetical protein
MFLVQWLGSNLHSIADLCVIDLPPTLATISLASSHAIPDLNDARTHEGAGSLSPPPFISRTKITNEATPRKPSWCLVGLLKWSTQQVLKREEDSKTDILSRWCNHPTPRKA